MAEHFVLFTCAVSHPARFGACISAQKSVTEQDIISPIDIHLEATTPMQRYSVVVFGAAKPSVTYAIRFIFVCYWGNIGDVIQELFKCYPVCIILCLETGVAK